MSGENTTQAPRPLPPELEANKWKPGQSGNPGGRPTTKPIREALARYYDPETEEGRARLDALAHQLHLHATSDKKTLAAHAQDYLRDTLDGPLPKETRLAGPEGTPLNVRMVLHEGGVGEDETPT